MISVSPIGLAHESTKLPNILRSDVSTLVFDAAELSVTVDRGDDPRNILRKMTTKLNYLRGYYGI